tara:strand:- start:1697 stop:2395 length:699 start_codon:yes stop_codon:yes gene_type:complete
MDPLQEATSEEVQQEIGIQDDAAFLRIFFHTLNIIADCKPPAVTGWGGDRGHALKLRETTNLFATITNVIHGTCWRTTLTSRGWKEFVSHLCALYAMIKYGYPQHAASRLAKEAKKQNDILQKGIWEREKSAALSYQKSAPELKDVPRKDVANQAKFDRYVAFFKDHVDLLEETVGHMLLAIRVAMTTDCKPNDVIGLKGTLPVEPGYQTERERMAESREIRAKEAASDDEW